MPSPSSPADSPSEKRATVPPHPPQKDLLQTSQHDPERQQNTHFSREPLLASAAENIQNLSDPSLLHTVMEAAIDAAEKAGNWGDVPVGAVVFNEDGPIAIAGNEREKRNDPTAHAEVLALRQAAATTGNRRLHGHGLAVTLEPCVMCAGAASLARVSLLVFGAPDLKAGATGSLYNICGDERLPHEIPVLSGFMAEESARLLETFFSLRRHPGP